MNSQIIGKLVEIESALRVLREEILLQSMEIERKKLSEIDLSSLIDITPAEWKEWFSRLAIPTPTAVTRYVDMLPGLMMGFPPMEKSPLLIEQQPYISPNSNLGHSLNVWLGAPVPWCTVEFQIPQALAQENPDFYFGWTSRLNASQMLTIDAFQMDEAFQITKTRICEEIVPGIGWSDVKPVHLKPLPNIMRTKIVFSFAMGAFQSIRFDELRLYIAKPAAKKPRK